MSHVRIHKLSRTQIESALLLIQARRDWSAFNAADYRGLGTIEPISHELAHALDLGPDFEIRLRAMGDDEADEHEARALRIELAGLAALGVRLSMRRLRVTANWRGGMDRVPSLAQLRAPLDRRERRCVQRFVAEVERAAGA